MKTGRPWLAMLLVFAGALALRLPGLDNRPMHGDEAVHAFKFRELWEKGTYRYDPNEFHGPTLYYATLPVVRLSGARRFEETTEAHYRLVTVAFGAGMVLLLALLADGLGWPAVLCAALLSALSPALVFYSRYYIQETLLAFFTLGMLATGWRYAHSGRPGWLIAAGVCAGLMVATKETAPLSFAAAAFALAVVRRWGGGVVGWSHGASARGRQMLLAALAALLTACLFLSGFLANPSAPLDYLRSYSPWLHRAGAAGLHQHPWHYYLGLLLWNHRGRGPVWTEALVLLPAAAGLAVAFAGRAVVPAGVDRRLLRFLGLYSLLLAAAYSLIPYKTPWCLLGFLQPMALLAGVSAVALVRLAPGRVLRRLAAALLLAGAVHLGWQSYLLTRVYEADGRNPYAYAQPVPDVVDLGARVEALARVSPQRQAMVVQVLSEDAYYWPLPWYLRRLRKVGYWTALPQRIEAPVVLASPRFSQTLARRLEATHRSTGYFGLRPTVLFEVWVRRELWKAYLRRR